jgi:hypothetical protein
MSQDTREPIDPGRVTIADRLSPIEDGISARYIYGRNSKTNRTHTHSRARARGSQALDSSGITCASPAHSVGVGSVSRGSDPSNTFLAEHRSVLSTGPIEPVSACTMLSRTSLRTRAASALIARLFSCRCPPTEVQWSAV